MVLIKSARIRVLLVIVMSISATAVAVWSLQKRFGYGPSEVNLVQSPPIVSPSLANVPTPLVVQRPPEQPVADAPEVSSASELSPTPTFEPLTLDPSYIGRLKLIVPVHGVKPEQLLDTFKDARSEGRVHDAIDIPAPAGTPVVAVADGAIVKLFLSERGGITIYQLSRDQKLIFYYAHLQGYADGLTVGKEVRQGEVIAFVGDTGNAGSGNFHLHFSIMVTNNPKRYWEGTNINPYQLLRK